MTAEEHLGIPELETLSHYDLVCLVRTLVTDKLQQEEFLTKCETCERELTITKVYCSNCH